MALDEASQLQNHREGGEMDDILSSEPKDPRGTSPPIALTTVEMSTDAKREGPVAEPKGLIRSPSDPSVDDTNSTTVSVNGSLDSTAKRTEQKVQQFRHCLDSGSLCDRTEKERRLVDWYEGQRDERRRARKRSDELENHRHRHHLHHNHEETTAASRTSSLLIISGPTGSGKSTLASSLRSTVEEQGGYLLSGKFDELQHCDPYGVIDQAFEKFSKQVLARGEEAVVETRSSILEAVGSSLNVMMGMLPFMKDIMDDGSEHGSCKAVDDPDRAKGIGEILLQGCAGVFLKFLGAVCVPKSPVVIVMEDLQWADHEALETLVRMTTGAARSFDLFVVGTVDDSNASSDCMLSNKLREIQFKSQADIMDIQLRNLDEKAIEQVVARTLDLPLDLCKPLAREVFLHARGNLFYTLNGLKWLQESDILFYDDEIARWTWDIEAIKAMEATPQRHHPNCLSRKLDQHLTAQAKESLKVAVCLGFHFHDKLVECVLGRSSAEDLKEAQAWGALAADDELGGYRFIHDGFQRAVYELIPESERALFHLEVGRRLWRKLDKEDLDVHIFLLVSQFNRGRDLIIREKERVAVANLCLHAGQKAARWSAFPTAVVCFNLGILLGGERSWKDEYDLTIALHNAGAEMEMCTANLERMDDLLDKVIENARCPRDKVQAYSTRMYAYGMSNRHDESIRLGLEALAYLGEKVPARACKARLMRELKLLSKQLKRSTNEQILRKPALEDEDKLACVRILQTMYLHSMMSRPMLAPFLVMKSMKIFLEHGLCAMASASFATFGMICITQRGDIESGVRHGQLGLAILERFGSIEYLPRVYAVYYSMIHPLKNPINQSLEPLQTAYQVGLDTGDIEFTTVCTKGYISTAMGAGVPLDRIDNEWRVYEKRMISLRQESGLAMALPLIQCIHHLMGLTPDPLASKGDVLDYDSMVDDAKRKGQYPRVLQIRASRLMVAFLFGAIELADRMRFKSCEFESFIHKIPPVYEKIVTILFECLTALAMAEKGTKRRANLRAAKNIVKMFEKWATLSPYK